jgi:hypothetical protein
VEKSVMVGCKTSKRESGKNGRIPMKLTMGIPRSDCGEKSEGRSGEREGERVGWSTEDDVRRSKVE